MQNQPSLCLTQNRLSNTVCPNVTTGYLLKLCASALVLILQAAYCAETQEREISAQSAKTSVTMRKGLRVIGYDESRDEGHNSTVIPDVAIQLAWEFERRYRRSLFDPERLEFNRAWNSVDGYSDGIDADSP